jgi:hypothetical protein
MNRNNVNQDEGGLDASELLDLAAELENRAHEIKQQVCAGCGLCDGVQPQCHLRSSEFWRN